MSRPWGLLWRLGGLCKDPLVQISTVFASVIQNNSTQTCTKKQGVTGFGSQTCFIWDQFTTFLSPPTLRGAQVRFLYFLKWQTENKTYHHELLEILQYLLFPRLLGGSSQRGWIKLNQIMHRRQWCLQAVDKRCQGKSLLRPTNAVLHQGCETHPLNRLSLGAGGRVRGQEQAGHSLLIEIHFCQHTYIHLR